MAGMTIDELYEAYMEGDVSFAQDVYGWFGGEKTELSPEDWEAKYGIYLPTYDPAQIHLAERERDLDYQKARDVLDISTKAADRVYTTEADTISTGLGKEIGKGRVMSGEIGLRSGALESAISDTIATSGNKVKDLGNRLMIQSEDDKNIYNAAMVDSALDFEKTEREEKEELYNRTMAAVQRLIGEGAFAEVSCTDRGQVECGDGSCADSPENCLDYQPPGGLEGIYEGHQKDLQTLKDEFDNCNSMTPEGGALDACWETLKAGADALGTDPIEFINWAFPDLKGDYEWWEERIRGEFEDVLGEGFVEGYIDQTCKNLVQPGCAGTCLGKWGSAWTKCVNACVARNC